MKAAKVVTDTSVLVVAIMSKRQNYASEVLDMVFSNKIVAYTSDQTKSELIDVFGREKFKGLLDTDRSQSLLHNYLTKCIKIKINGKLLDIPDKICKDPKDYPFLAIAEQEKCEYIISLDTKDLLSIREYKASAIVTPKEFIEVIS